MVDSEFGPHQDPVPPPAWPWDPEVPSGATVEREIVTNADGTTTETVTLAEE
jgi:hypothetical protein